LSAAFEGGCHCRAVRYRCNAEPALVLCCHCRDCRYASKAACTTVVVVKAENLAIEGEPSNYRSRSDSGVTVFRQFCGSCGSPLFAGNEAFPGFVAIKAATLDDSSCLRPTAQVSTESAHPWANLARHLENFGEG
jgi:hypothetical protein